MTIQTSPGLFENLTATITVQVSAVMATLPPLKQTQHPRQKNNLDWLLRLRIHHDFRDASESSMSVQTQTSTVTMEIRSIWRCKRTFLLLIWLIRSLWRCKCHLHQHFFQHQLLCQHPVPQQLRHHLKTASHPRPTLCAPCHIVNVMWLNSK